MTNHKIHKTERTEVCQSCNNYFVTDSLFVDKYCGNCRIEYYQTLKQLRKLMFQNKINNNEY